MFNVSNCYLIFLKSDKTLLDKADEVKKTTVS
jgi:hypothetical protein